MPLTDTAIKAIKPANKPQKLSDGQGLFLLVTPSGSKLWRFKYRFDGLEKLLSIGAYPETKLASARAARDSARKLLSNGIDPSLLKQREKAQARISAGNTFGDIAREYIAKRTKEGLAVATVEKFHFLLKHLDPRLGKMPIADIIATDVLHVLRKIEGRGNLESARRTLQFSSQVFRYGVATARLVSDPTRDLRGALIVPQTKHFAALLEPQKVGELLRAIEGYDGQIATHIALKLSPYVFVRPGELRQARWEEIDLDCALWIIPSQRMKMRKEHQVPLSSQAVALFTTLRGVSGAESGYVFPSIRTTSRPMSENTINGALRRLGYSSDEMTGHGFRAMASTLLNESGKWQPDAIERALSHKGDDKIRATYNRGQYWAERVAMSQWWADHLDTLRKGADIVPFKHVRTIGG